MYYKMQYLPDQHPAKVPLKAGKTGRQQKPRSSHTRTFDPDELTKRLYIVLAEQKAHAERKRRAQAKTVTKDSAAARPATRDTRKDAGASAAPEKVTALVLKKSRSILRPRTKARSGHVLDEKEQDKLIRINSKTSTGFSEKDRADETFPTYHHIPQVAADQFSRTTTVDMPTDKNLIHKLSRKAMKFHMDGPQASRGLSATANADAAPFEQHKALQRAQSMRDRQYERNQFQHTPTLAPTAEVHEGRTRHKHHRHSLQHQNIEEQFRATLAAQKSKLDVRRMSTGSMLVKPKLVNPIEEQDSFVALSDKPESCVLCDALPVNVDEHRVDWSQSDELATLPKQVTPPPQLRKSDSRWTFRGRLGSFTKHGKDDKSSSPHDEEGTTLGEPPKSPKNGFFARFKR